MVYSQPNPATYSPYPGEYIPAPLALDELAEELRKPHEGANKPLVNIAELPDLFKVEVAAPGLKSGDFYVNINGNLLSIYVLHKEPEGNTKIYLQHEFNYCCFKRDIILPDKFDTEFLYARYADGVLCISLPKATGEFVHRVSRVMVY
jgi:HSP20 family protein